MNIIHAESPATPDPAVNRSPWRESVRIPINGIALPAELVVPPGAIGLALFIVANGCIRETPRTELMAQAIQSRGVATLSLSLLRDAEARKDASTGYWNFDLDLLTHRILSATGWALRQPATRNLGIGYIATSTAAAATLVAAAELGYAVGAVVARSGRPDFAGDSLRRVTAPTLLIVGERDEAMRAINRRSLDDLLVEKRLSIVAGAGHLFDEPGSLEQVGELAAEWFSTHLKAIKRT